ncbi:MAG: 2'-5' RNA ligase family protein [Alphaproteobacteria bacterium]
MLAVIAVPALGRGDAARIAAIRRRHDPRFGALPPHVTLAFPKAVEAPAAAGALVDAVAASGAAVAATLRGADVHRLPGRAGWLVMLAVGAGAGAVGRLHHRLDRGPLAGNRRGRLPYRPHLTVAAGLTAPAAARLAARVRRWVPIRCRLTALQLVAWDGRRLETVGSFRLGGF